MKIVFSLCANGLKHALSVAAAAVFSTITVLNAASQEPIPCSDILYLIEQSKTQFLAIRGSAGNEQGGYETTFVLSGAWFCVILEDAEKGSYQCTWKHPHGDERAQQQFLGFVKEMRSCIGHFAEERKDQSVNHPDFYASYFYRLPGGEASVTLKNKSKLMSTLVSIGIDGFTKPE